MQDVVSKDGSRPAGEAAIGRAGSMQIVDKCLGDTLAAADHAREHDDADAVHDLRVAIRRLRAAIAILRRSSPSAALSAVNARLREFQQALGAAREWDVLIDQTVAAMPKRARRRLHPLVEAAEAQRADAHQRARAAVRSRKQAAFLPRLRSELGDSSRADAVRAPTPADHEASSASEPFAGFVADLLRSRHRKVRKLGKDHAELDAKGLHALRIRVKKLRYDAQFFQDIWPGRRTRRYLERLADLQQVLGDVHDAFIAMELAGKLKSNGTGSMAQSAETLRDWANKCVARDRRRLARRWNKFDRRKRFWKPG
jgi:triphosphatase